MSAETIAGPGSRVRMAYRISLSDGRVVDEVREDEPTELTLGVDGMLPGLELCLHGLKAGDRAEFVIEPEALGIHGLGEPPVVLSRDDFPVSLTLVKDQLTEFNLPDGRTFAGRVVSFNKKEVVVDFTHPLAGQTIKFAVHVIAVESTHTSIT